MAASVLLTLGCSGSPSDTCVASGLAGGSSTDPCAATGGALTGGSSSAGNSSIGGSISTGGVSTTGGSPTAPTGGVAATGGSSAAPTGGASPTGGSSAAPTGGVAATGGSSAAPTGGASPTGGSSAAPTGGVAATGGSSAAPTGGVAATGGSSAAPTGGASPTGGSAATGGSSSAGNEVTCATLPAITSGTCEVTAGGDAKLILGTVLTPGKIYRGGQVLVDATGTIACVGCDCASLVTQPTKITCPTGVISPGLINTHDHLTYTQNNPNVSATGEHYEDRQQWRLGGATFENHSKISAVSGSSAQVSWGELRFLMGGTTATVGSGSAPFILRNLDVTAQQIGLNQTPVSVSTFPLGDSAGTRLSSGCGYPSVIAETSITNFDAFLPHAAEGIDAYAHNEFTCLSASNPGHDFVVDKSAFVNSIALAAADYSAMAQAGTALVWSPRSNISLYGDTSAVTEAARMGVLIALGTDWIISGSMNMLRELKCADQLNSKYLGSYFTDEQLWMMATSNAAAATATDEVIGTLAPGKIADLSIFDGKTNKDFRAVIDAEPQDVTLVMRAGKVLYGDDAVVAATTISSTCDTLKVCSTSKRLCLSDEIGQSYTQLATAVGSIYSTYFCGTPTNEPSCVPSRPTPVNGSTVYTGQMSASDLDGDGIPNALDNCPSIFNPIRPMDNGAQADADGDGTGDVCDVCPLAPNSTTCTVYNALDTDGDGVLNALDNCPNDSNANQADTDGDQRGDICDACPNQANPGNLACFTDIYSIKNRTIPVGSAVALQNVLVTGRTVQGYFLQVTPGDPGYAGSDYSGIYVYDTANTVTPGDRVTITRAIVTDYYTQIQLTSPTATIVSTGESLPAPVAALPSEVTTGGTRALALEGVTVRVSGTTVTDIAPPLGSGDSAPSNEFVVAGSLRVDDLMYLVAPFPAVGNAYTSITGILTYRTGNSKLEPRNAADLVQ